MQGSYNATDRPVCVAAARVDIVTDAVTLKILLLMSK